MCFEDNFSELAEAYARYRPQYPPELFAYLASIAPGLDLAWDCGTGNGQAAIGLAQYFHRVCASDASAEQISHARPHNRVSYQVFKAEHSPLPHRSVDLICVAEALHWFELESFYAEARRVLKPGGVLAAWCYHLPEIEPGVDALLARYFSEVVGPYWSPRIRLVDERYRTIPFPFAELYPPAFEMSADWDFDTLLGFLYSWSANQKFIEAHGFHPINAIKEELDQAWKNTGDKRPVRWPLYFRIGK